MLSSQCPRRSERANRKSQRPPKISHLGWDHVVSEDVSRVMTDNMINVRVARDDSVKDNEQGPTNPPCIRERKRLREHANAKQQGGSIEKLAKTE
jgi:hypothetical protein